MNALEASISVLRPRAHGLRQTICPACGSVGDYATCGACPATLASAAPRRGAEWSAGGFRFLLATTSAIASARGHREPHFERRFLDLGLDERIAILPPQPLVRETHLGRDPSTAPPTCGLGLSWLLARIAALADGTTAVPKQLTYGDQHETCGDCVLDIVVARRRVLVAGLCVIGAPDRLMLIVDEREPSARAVDAFVASLRAAPRELAPIAVRVRSGSFVRDPDVYRVVPKENVFGWGDGTLLGGDNPIYSSHRRPPPDPVTPDVLPQVLDLGESVTGWSLALANAPRPLRNASALIDCAVRRADLHPLCRVRVEHEDPVVGFTQIALSLANHAPELERCDLGPATHRSYYGPPDESDDVPVTAPRSDLGFVQLEGDAFLPLELGGLAFPRVRELVFRHIGRVKWDRARLDQLERLELRYIKHARETLRSLATIRLPRLGALVVTAADDEPADIIVPLLDVAPPSLVDLELSGIADAAVLDRLAAPPWATRLRRLVFAGEAETGLVAARTPGLAAIAELLVGGRDLRSPQERVVVHARFGRGRVIREVPGPGRKLEIVFDSGERKLLLERFVQDA